MGSASALLSACAGAGPNFERPEVPHVARPLAPENIEFTDRTDPRWWRSFHDDTLTTIIEGALETSPEIRLALSRVKEARADMGYARADLLPHIGASAQMSRDRTSASAWGSFGESTTSTFYQAAFDATWEIDLFGGRRRAFEAAAAMLDARNGEAVAVRVMIAAEIARTYVELRALQERLGIARSALANAEDLVALTRHRFEAGASNISEVNRALAETATRRAQIPALEGEIERTLDQLAVITGKPPGTFAHLASRNTGLPGVLETPEIAYPAYALRARPDVWAAERQLAAATAEIGVAKAELYPRLVLPGSGGVLVAAGDGLFSADNLMWKILPSLSLGLFSGGRIRANIDAAGARAEQAGIAFDQTALNALLEISEGLSLRRSSVKQADNLRQARTAAQEAANILRERYALGAEGLFPVLDAEAAALEAADGAVLAEAEVLLALISLYKATAGAPIDAVSYGLAGATEPAL
ncbi:MAG: efflux transporter outer membrane subunit [Novosphingobium sp.]